ncbi:MAG: hypothetical protein ACP5O6_12850 [Candidatus Baltobacteraceae bacterium]
MKAQRKNPPLQTTGRDQQFLADSTTQPRRSASEAINRAMLNRMIADQEAEEKQRPDRAEIGDAIKRAWQGETRPDYCFDEGDPAHVRLLEQADADVRSELVRWVHEAAKILALRWMQRGCIR